MSTDDWFTLIWGTASVLIGAVGGYIIYKRQKQAQTLSNKKEK